MCPSLSGATISIQETEISIVEETSGQICIVVENDDAELERDVSVTLTTTAGTAGNCVLSEGFLLSILLDKLGAPKWE